MSNNETKLNVNEDRLKLIRVTSDFLSKEKRMSLAQSVLYNFISEKYGLSLHFLEGQEIINTLATLSTNNNHTFTFMREMVLSMEPLVSFLAPQEGMGLFIDSDNPYLRFKLETNQAGFFRAMILPQDIEAPIDTINGTCRLSKIFKKSGKPYTSILKLEQTPISQIVNIVLTQSYQIESETLISNSSDQSLMIVKIPPQNLLNSKNSDFESPSSFSLKNKEEIENFFSKAATDEAEIKNFFMKFDFKYLGKKNISFNCPCSRDRMILGLKSLGETEILKLLQQKDSQGKSQEKHIETKCDYCHTYYAITESELLG